MHDNKGKLIFEKGGKFSTLIKRMSLWKDQGKLLLKIFWLSLYMVYGLSFLSLTSRIPSGSLENQVPCELLRMEVSCVRDSWLLKIAISFLKSQQELDENE